MSSIEQFFFIYTYMYKYIQIIQIRKIINKKGLILQLKLQSSRNKISKTHTHTQR